MGFEERYKELGSASAWEAQTCRTDTNETGNQNGAQDKAAEVCDSRKKTRGRDWI